MEPRQQPGIPEAFGANRAPSGTMNFGNLLRDPAMVLSEIVAREVPRPATPISGPRCSRSASTSVPAAPA
jgi:hypothetical protein